jgi:hypothetical protein
MQITRMANNGLVSPLFPDRLPSFVILGPK